MDLDGFWFYAPYGSPIPGNNVRDGMFYDGWPAEWGNLTPLQTKVLGVFERQDVDNLSELTLTFHNTRLHWGFPALRDPFMVGFNAPDHKDRYIFPKVKKTALTFVFTLYPAQLERFSHPHIFFQFTAGQGRFEPMERT